MLPVELPDITDFEPRILADDDTALPEPPLARAEDWVHVELDLGDGPQRYRRETNTMPQWAGSCWYYLRYLDPTNADALVDPEIERYWMVGDGAPTAASTSTSAAPSTRCCTSSTRASGTRCCSTSGHVSTPEPFHRLFNQGTITAAAFTDERGVYVEASEVEERDGSWFHDGAEVDAPRRQDGQEPEERGRARRHLPRLRRRHAAALRDVHGPARRQPAVEHAGHRRRAQVPPAVLAQRGRRGHRRAPRHRGAGRRRDPPPAAPHHRRGAATTWRRSSSTPRSPR